MELGVRGQYAGVRSQGSVRRSQYAGVRSRRWSEGPSEGIRRIRRGLPNHSDTLH